MPYASEGLVSQAAIDGGIEISEAQYQEALDGMAAGRVVTVAGGFAVIDPPGPEAEPEPEPPTLAEAKAAKRAEIEGDRKKAEAEGVTVNGIRYAGDPSNRQALGEALDLAERTGQTEFSSWKDSDGTFHAAHPVADVDAALMAIAQRRGELIEREGTLAAQIDAAATVAEVEAVVW